MRFLSYLPLLLVSIPVAAFLIKLVVSLRVANKGTVWQGLGNQELGNEEPGAIHTPHCPPLATSHSPAVIPAEAEGSVFSSSPSSAAN
jgi:hypothetical protein